MKPLPIHSYAMSQLDGAEPTDAMVPLPPPGANARKPRLATLATQLAERAVSTLEGAPPSPLAVYFGTALGSLTETAAFLENMIERQEAAPKPRAFTYSVHNAAASRVAQTMKARGENQTFVHGEISYAVALWSAQLAFTRDATSVLVGAADETSRYVERARTQCCPDTATSPVDEGGAMLLSLAATERPAIATIRTVAFARPRDPQQWLAAHLADTPVDQLLHGVPTDHATAVSTLAAETLPYVETVGTHPSAGCVALATAIATIADGHRSTVGVVTASRFGDWSLVVVGP